LTAVRSRLRRDGAALVVLAWLLGAACSESSGSPTTGSVLAGEDPIAEEVSELQRALLRGGGTVRASTPLTRSPHGVKGSWEIELSATWTEYAAWVRERIEAPFELREQGTDRLVLQRRTPTDVYTLTVERISAGIARIELAGAPW
jgi:hypothetical protein